MKLSSLLLAGDVGDIMYEELLPENVPLFGGLFGDRHGHRHCESPRRDCPSARGGQKDFQNFDFGPRVFRNLRYLRVGRGDPHHLRARLRRGEL